MTGATAREHDDGGGTSPAAGVRTAGDLEVPRPLRLILTAGWNLTESVGLPVAAYAVAAWAGGRDAGMVAGLAAIWVLAAAMLRLLVSVALAIWEWASNDQGGEPDGSWTWTA